MESTISDFYYTIYSSIMRIFPLFIEILVHCQPMALLLSMSAVVIASGNDD